MPLSSCPTGFRGETWTSGTVTETALAILGALMLATMLALPLSDSLATALGCSAAALLAGSVVLTILIDAQQ